MAKNEAIIYETLVDKGDLSVSDIARESGINRRNIYDTLNRLLEKGLTYEIKLPKETIYKAVEISKGGVKELDFLIPVDFEIVTEEELMEKLGG